MTLRLLGFYGSAIALEAAKQLGLRVENHTRYVSIDSISRCQPGQAAVIWVPETHDPGEGVVNLYGQQGLFAFNNSGCLRNPRVKQRLLQRIREAAEKGCNTVVLDALRYPGPSDGSLFLSCFCPYCKRANPGLERVRERLFSAIRERDPVLLARALEELAVIRALSVEEALEQASREARSLGLRLEAAVFPPSLAPLVGQRLDRLAQRLDRVQIMLYHRCNGPACHNHEYAALQRLLVRLVDRPEEVLKVLGISAPAQPDELEKKGTPPGRIVEEAKEAKRLLGSKAVPILWLDNAIAKILEEITGLYDNIILFAPR